MPELKRKRRVKTTESQSIPSAPSIGDVIAGKREYYIEHGDVIRYMRSMPESCIDHAVFSPPFPAVFAYQSDVADIGNSEDVEAEAPLHFTFFFRQLLRVIKPGRVVICHCTQIPRLKRTGKTGLFDFRGLLIRIAQRCGFIYEYDWLVTVNPQKQAILTHSHELQFAGLEKDRAQCRGCLCMYLIKFQAPGENAIAVNSPNEVTRNDWIDLAEGAWDNIVGTDTLNAAEARSPEDTHHICPMPLRIYENTTKLYTNPGEIVFDPFAGIGSGGFVTLGGESPKTHRFMELPRRFVGCELKPEYHQTALRNCDRAIRMRDGRQKDLFSGLEDAK